jgi:hypothetical protein
LSLIKEKTIERIECLEFEDLGYQQDIIPLKELRKNKRPKEMLTFFY